MMIGIGERRDVLGVRLQVDYHLLGRCDTRKQQDIHIRLDVAQRFVVTIIQRFQLIVFQCGEEQLLIRIEVHGPGEHAELHRLEVARTFRDDHDISTVLTLLGLPQHTGGQQLVVDNETVVVNQQDIDAWLDVAMLESIVKQHHIGVLCLLVACETIDAMTTVPVNGDIDIRILLLHLVRLITNHTRRGVLVGQHIARALALVAPAEYCHLRLVLKQTNQILYMRCLARAAHCDVPHRDDGGLEGTAFQHAHLKQLVAESYTDTVEPADGQQPFAYLDEITFHGYRIFR